MAQAAKVPAKRRRAARAHRVRTSRLAVDLKSLKLDAFHLVDLGGIPHAIRRTSDGFIEFYEVVEG